LEWIWWRYKNRYW